MSEDRIGDDGAEDGQRSWLERLGDALLREPKDRHQLIHVLREAQGRGLLDFEALVMIEGVLEVSGMQVRDIMIPRNQMVVVERDARPEDYLPILIESAHSRFPIIGDSKDEVEGILLAKDLLAYFAQRDKPFDIREVMRPAVFIPESKRLNVLLKEFRSSRNHMAVVVDEYGGVAGLVTIEDVLEQIVGDIEDEHDIDEDIYITHRSDGSYTVKAFTPIEDFNKEFFTDFDDEDFDTIGGLIINQFGRMPRQGEQVTVNGFRFTVLRSDIRRLHLLRMERIIEPAVMTDQDSSGKSDDTSAPQ